MKLLELWDQSPTDDLQGTPVSGNTFHPKVFLMNCLNRLPVYSVKFDGTSLQLVDLDASGRKAAIKDNFIYLPSGSNNLQPAFDELGFFLLVAYQAAKLKGFIKEKQTEKEVKFLESWQKYLEFVESKPGKSILEMTQFLGICRELMEDTAEIIQKDLKRFKDSEVLVSTFSNFTLNNIDRDASEIITELTFMSSSLGKVLKGAAITQSFKIEAKRVELTTQTIASLGSNGLLVGPPGTGKTWQVQRAVSLPTIQVSLEGSTEPETVVANIAQNQEGKFQAFLAETGKALKLGMLLAIVHCLRKKNALKDIFNSEIGTKSVILPNLPAALQNLLPKKQFESFSSDFIFLIENLHTVLLNGDESEIKQWLGLFDTYADPFALDRWNEVLNLYQKLGANKVGTTVILSVEEIYHAVENRKILDLLINLMAGQKKLPLTKAGVVGGDLFGFNVSVWATGNPLRDAYLPEALSSRFSFQQFVGYPTAEEEKRRMALAREAITNPEEMKLNLISTELSDYWDLQPLAKPDLTKISANLRAKIYKIVQWTRIQFNSGNLRSCACPRMASFWEVLSCAFTAQQVPEKDAVSLAVEASVISLVDLDQNACPDNAQLINVRQFVESVMKD